MYKSISKFMFFFLYFSIFISNAFSYQELSRDHIEYALIDYDLENSLTRKDIEKLNFQPVDGAKNNFGFTNKTLILRLKIENKNKSKQKKIIFNEAGHANSIIVYKRSKHEENFKSYYRIGRDYKFRDRYYKMTRNFHIPISLPAKTTSEFYLKINSHNSMNFWLKLYDEKEFVEFLTADNFYNGINIGLALFLILISLGIFVLKKSKQQLYFLLHSIFGLLNLFNGNSLGFQLIWFNLPEFWKISAPFIISLNLIFALLFYRSVVLPFENKKINQFFSLTFLSSICLSSFNFIIGVSTPNNMALNIQLSYTLILVIYVIILAIVISAAILKRSNELYFFSLCVFLYGGGLFWNIAAKYKLVPFIPNTAQNCYIATLFLLNSYYIRDLYRLV